MYIGEVIEAAPTPMPPMILKIINWVKVLGMAVPTAEIRKRTADIKRTFFLPSRSLRTPAKEAPIMQPTRAQEAVQPVHFASRMKCDLRKPMAPLITAVS